MALSFSEKVNVRIGRRKFKVYEVTHDGSETSIDASDLGLNYIDYSLLDNKGALSSDAADFNYMGTATGTYIGMTNALSASAVDVLQVWGY